MTLVEWCGDDSLRGVWESESEFDGFGDWSGGVSCLGLFELGEYVSFVCLLCRGGFRFDGGGGGWCWRRWSWGMVV